MLILNRKEFHTVFTGIATVNAGMTTYLIVKSVQFCVAGLIAPAVLEIYVAGVGAYTVYKIMKSIKKLEGRV
jgi:hypothetical protein